MTGIFKTIVEFVSIDVESVLKNDGLLAHNDLIKLIFYKELTYVKIFNLAFLFILYTYYQYFIII